MKGTENLGQGSAAARVCTQGSRVASPIGPQASCSALCAPANAAQRMFFFFFRQQLAPGFDGRFDKAMLPLAPTTPQHTWASLRQLLHPLSRHFLDSVAFLPAQVHSSAVSIDSSSGKEFEEFREHRCLPKAANALPLHAALNDRLLTLFLVFLFTTVLIVTV